MNNKESADGWSLDSAETVNHVSLCAGYGGIDLGLRRAIRGIRTIAVCEIEAFACANLVAKMEAGLLDPAPIWTDVKTFPWSAFRGKVDILSGGYPCQPFSAAGKRLGKDDPRHLWPWIADGIAAMRPRVCFFENVEGHITLGLRDVLQDLAGLGYRTTWGIFSASEVGAPHQRKRVFILADCDNTRLEGHGRHVAEHDSQRWQGTDGYPWPSRPGEQQFAWEPPRVVGDADHGRQPSGIDAGSRTEADRGGEGDIEQADGGMGDTEGSQDNRREPGDMEGPSAEWGCGDDAADGTGKVLGNPDSPRPQERAWKRGAGIQGTDTDGGTDAERQTEPPLGRDADGAAGGVGDAELFTSYDNRTDELRLLGNGVVPQTAEVAWRTLVDELINHKETER